MEKKREYGLDLLRILSMLMVVCNHLVSWDILLADVLEPLSPMWYAAHVFRAFQMPAVNCFVLISGYFLCSTSFKLKKAATLWLEIVFYSVGLYLLDCIFTDHASFSFAQLIRRCLVISTQQYWYVTAYMLMYIVSPFLNCMIHSMSKRMHALCCIVLSSVFCVASNLLYIKDFAHIISGYSFLWFCVLYMIAAYIRLHVTTRVKYQKWMFPVSILFCLALCGTKFLSNLITPQIFGAVILEDIFYAYNSILITPCALALFQGFRGVELGNL